MDYVHKVSRKTINKSFFMFKYLPLHGRRLISLSFCSLWLFTWRLAPHQLSPGIKLELGVQLLNRNPKFTLYQLCYLFLSLFEHSSSFQRRDRVLRQTYFPSILIVSRSESFTQGKQGSEFEITIVFYASTSLPYLDHAVSRWVNNCINVKMQDTSRSLTNY